MTGFFSRYLLTVERGTRLRGQEKLMQLEQKAYDMMKSHKSPPIIVASVMPIIPSRATKPNSA